MDFRENGRLIENLFIYLLLITFPANTLAKNGAIANEYWVRPDTMVECPHHVPQTQCVTITDLVTSNTSTSINKNRNMSIYVLPGVHVPTREGWIFFASEGLFNTNKELFLRITIQGVQNNDSIINCSLGANIGFIFYALHSLTISNINMFNCGCKVIHEEKRPILYDLINETITVIAVNLQLNFTHVQITRSNGVGVVILSYLAKRSVHLYITNCTIEQSATIAERKIQGNIYISINQSPHNQQVTLLSIKDSSFLDGSADCTLGEVRYPFLECFSGGLTLRIEYYKKIKIKIKNCTFKNNRAVVGGGMLIAIDVRNDANSICKALAMNYLLQENFDNQDFAELVESFFNYYCPEQNDSITDHKKVEASIQTSVFVNNTARAHGGGMAIAWHIKEADSNYKKTCISLQVHKTTFELNRAKLKGGGLYINIADHANFLYYLQNSIFLSNFASIGIALYILDNPHWMISECTFTKNSQLTEDNTDTGVIHASLSDNRIIEGQKGHAGDLSIKNIVVRNNTARALYLFSTKLFVHGNNTIENNYAKSSDGGGILFDCPIDISMSTRKEWYGTQHLYLQKESYIYIISNKADHYGGGIAITDGCEIRRKCFFRSHKHSDQTMITLSGNSAKLGGYSIYGGHLEKQCKNQTHLWKIINIVGNSVPSAVSSLPYHVCICNLSFPKTHKCSKQLTISAYPGQEFKVPVVCGGQFNHSSVCTVQVEVLSSSTASITEHWTLRQVGLECTNLSYPIESLNTQINITLRLNIQDSLSKYDSRPALTPAEITVWIKACPPGFTQAANTGRCICTSYLAQRGVTCNITSEKIYKTSSMWVGNYSGDVTVHQHCPLDYCKVNFTAVDPYNQQEQCAFRRSGVLCGACRPGLSLVLGTSQCKECSNIYLLLLIPFTVAGVVLVVFLLKCNLTVSMGTISGLIFYANIVRATQTAFFPVSGKSILVHILSVFIAWLNLDLGIETCLFDGLDTYNRTWLQFVFPLYIWTLVGLLIIVSRYSIKVSRWTGSNTVSVLATLFLLSYAKLLRTTFDILTPTSLTDAHDNTTLVWLVDGNYQFLQWPHSLLFTAALVTLLIHILPFTFLLLTAPILQRYSHHKPLRWVNKLMPLFDAYQGPYKAKARYYTGLLLLVRLVILSAVALNVSGNQSVDLFVLSIVIGSVLILTVFYARKLYRKKLPIVFELFLLGNLLLLILSALFLHSNEQLKTNGQSALIICMVGSAFAVSGGIVLHHLYGLCLKIDAVKRFKTRVASLIRTPKEEDEDKIIETMINPPQSRAPTTTVVELKEALLASDDDN